MKVAQKGDATPRSDAPENSSKQKMGTNHGICMWGVTNTLDKRGLGVELG